MIRYCTVYYTNNISFEMQWMHIGKLCVRGKVIKIITSVIDFK